MAAEAFLKIIPALSTGLVAGVGALGYHFSNEMAALRADAAAMAASLAAAKASAAAKTSIVEGVWKVVRGAGEITCTAIKESDLRTKILVGTAAYAAWLTYEYVPRPKVSKVAGAVLPGARRVRNWFGKAEIVADPRILRGNQNSMLAESRRDGSAEQDLTVPSFQCKIGTYVSGQFSVLGSAVRFSTQSDKHYLVGPDHVLGESEGEVKYAKGKQSEISLRGRERIPLETDLVMIELTDKEMSTIGIQKAKITGVPSMGIIAQVVGAMSKGTFGRLVNDPMAFGRVVYEGTTVGGYSGGAYTCGTAMLGIHQMGGNINGGLSASYVWMLIKRHAGVTEEDSEDWLLGQYKSGRRIRWKNSHDPEYVEVETGGKYSQVLKISMHKAFGQDWETSDFIERTANRTYDDVYECVATPAGEANSSKRPGVSSVLHESRESAEQKPLRVIPGLQQLSKKQLADTRKYVQELLSQRQTSSGQAKSVLGTTSS
uniref:Uncharacterized protein n=1 Tax=Medway virus TaxID=2170576 RepID=A0A2S0S4M6_9VIRU|nr:hypothetical protein [Medway virus]